MALIAWYPLNGDTKDYSGNDIHGINNGVKETTEGKIGKAHAFENDSSGVNIPNENFTHLKEYSMSAWVKPKGNHNNYNGAIISSGNWNNKAWSFGLNQNNTSIDVASNSYNEYITYSTPLNEWTHITSTMKNNIAKVYVNGKYITQRPAVAQLQSDASNTLIGRETYAGGHFSFNGDLNDIRIYDHELSKKEVQEIAKAKILHYKFDDPYEEPTENIQANPEFEKNWGAWDSSTVTYEDNKVLGKKTRIATLRTSSNGVSNAIHQSVEGYTPGKLYTLSAYIRISPEQVATKALLKIYINRYENVEVTKEWRRVSVTQLVSASSNTTHITQTTLCDFEISFVQIEKKNQPTPFVNNIRKKVLYDNSGFNNNTTIEIEESPIWEKDSFGELNSFNFLSNRKKIKINHLSSEKVSASFWYKWTKHSDTWRTVFASNGNIHPFIFDSYRHPSIFDGSQKRFNYIAKEDKWEHYVVIWEKEKAILYVNGKYISEVSTSLNLSESPLTTIGNWDNGSYPAGSLSSIKIYAEKLSQKDILELYQSRANVDNKGNLKINNINETINLAEPMNQAIKEKSFKNGLSSYPQENTKITLTDIGYRIYRPPNLIHADVGNTMWGGLRLHFFNIDDGILVEGRKYRVEFRVSGQSSNGISGPYFTNNMGWGGAAHGLSTNGPTKRTGIPYNFKGSQIVYSEFHITDKIWKTATSSYSSFKEGETYNTYRDLAWNFNYENTGTLGTDLYVTDIKLVDITENKEVILDSKGVISPIALNEIGLPVRYIRESMNGSNKNAGNHWVEIEAYDQNDINIALGKIGNHALLTDGSTATSPWTSISPATVDLGDIYHVNYLKMYHYYSDSRIYNDIKTEVSANGTDWTTVFDSNIDGEYVETAAGNTIILRPKKMIQDSKGNLYVNEIKEV